MFNTIWFCLVLSTSHFTFFCFLFQLISSLRYKICLSFSWFNVNRGLKWRVLVQYVLLSPPRSSSNIFLPELIWKGLKKWNRWVSSAQTGWLVLRFLSLAASWELILRMDSGVAKVNPGSPSVSSDQVCKSVPFKNISHLVDPSSLFNWVVVVGNLSNVDWYLLVGKNNALKTPLTEHKLG